MSRIIELLYGMIRENAEHGVHQFTIGLPKLQSVIDGARRSWFVLLGGGSGSGRSTFVLYCYVYKPIMQCIKEGNHNYRVWMYNLEMESYIVLLKLMSFYIWDKYGKEMGVRDILSFKGPLQQDSMDMIYEAREMMEKMAEYITFYEKDEFNADKLYENTVNYYYGKGQFDAQTGKFMPDNPKAVEVGIIDHIGETPRKGGQSRKDAVDDVADACKKLRNVYGSSWVVLQQLNRGMSDVKRREKYSGIEPDDFKDSGNVYEKADVVLGLYYPFKMKDFNAGGYNIREMKNRLRIMQVLKGRFGEADIAFGLAFYGLSGLFAELPKSGEISNYSVYDTPEWLKANEAADQIIYDL